ncbi:NADPH-dependent FMN reductase [Streptomyces sp. NPDC057654]|uniref:NADPH-dependent FMN reductase n=1 Tax=Streptomyces sp. NPDC057654 TaxID=3346196 RepID=UPI003697EE99
MTTPPTTPPTTTPTASERPYRLAVIIGSTREGRFGPTVANWFIAQAARRDDVDTHVIDLAETPLPLNLSGQPDAGTAAALAAVTPHLAAADAFVVVTPEYNHSYPASLKNLLDWHREEWQAKPVGFVSYGGLSGGLRAVEHLRPVFSELHTVTVRDTVSFHMPWGQFDEDGTHKDGAAASAAAKTMLDQLGWWARALLAAREVRPYGS